jgi:hypothetical protein
MSGSVAPALQGTRDSLSLPPNVAGAIRRGGGAVFSPRLCCRVF